MLSYQLASQAHISSVSSIMIATHSTLMLIKASEVETQTQHACLPPVMSSFTQEMMLLPNGHIMLPLLIM